MADAALVAVCLLYVLHKAGEPPAPVGELKVCKYDKFRGFQTAVVDEVVKSGSFNDYTRRQLESGFFFVLPHPPDSSRPSRPAGSGIVMGSVTLSQGDCILLDISASVPATPATTATTPGTAVVLGTPCPTPSSGAAAGTGLDTVDSESPYHSYTTPAGNQSCHSTPTNSRLQTAFTGVLQQITGLAPVGHQEDGQQNVQRAARVGGAGIVRSYLSLLQAFLSDVKED